MGAGASAQARATFKLPEEPGFNPLGDAEHERQAKEAVHAAFTSVRSVEEVDLQVRELQRLLDSLCEDHADKRLWIEHQLQSYMQRRAALHDEHPVFTAHKIISPIEEESEEDVLEEEAEARAVPVVCLASAVASPSAGILDPADSKGHPTWLDGCEGKLFPLGK